MKLYIKIENGFPVNHPAFEDNLIDAFGEIPSDWEPFIRVESPTTTNNKIILNSPSPYYKKVNGVWQDYWDYRNKTPEEIEEMYRPYKESWLSREYASNFTAWIFNEETLKYEAPFPRPTDGKFYRWCGAENNWKEAPMFPNDGKKYKFDFNTWTNVEREDVAPTPLD